MHNRIDRVLLIIIGYYKKEGSVVDIMYMCNIKPYLQKPLRELGRLCLSAGEQSNEVVTEVRAEPRGGLPLLQVWPSDSPRGEADGQAQAFVFPDVQENVNDSGIESIQVTKKHL